MQTKLTPHEGCPGFLRSFEFSTYIVCTSPWPLDTGPTELFSGGTSALLMECELCDIQSSDIRTDFRILWRITLLHLPKLECVRYSLGQPRIVYGIDVPRTQILEPVLTKSRNWFDMSPACGDSLYTKYYICSMRSPLQESRSRQHF